MTRKEAVLQVTGKDTKKDSDEHFVKPLAIATTVAGTAFVLSSILYIVQRRRR
jgi:hypothetical protein